jgi:hypothetical protein
MIQHFVHPLSLVFFFLLLFCFYICSINFCRYGESLGNTFTIYQNDSSSTRRNESQLSSSKSGSPLPSVSSLITSPVELDTKPIENEQRPGKSVSQANTIDQHDDEIFDFVALAPSSEFTSGFDDTSQQKDVELQLDINKLTHRNIWTPAIHFSCSPSSYSTESSSSMCSNASDGTRTPVSTYGDSERSDTPSALHNDQHQQQPNKSYCGYVESYPYYYKLSRLYNALTIQKMQSDRLRKQLIGPTNKHPQQVQLNQAMQTKQQKQSLKQNKTHKSQSQSRLTNAINIPIQQQVSPSVTPPKSPYRQNNPFYGQVPQSASPLNYMFFNQIQQMVPEINQAPQTMSTVTATQSTTQQPQVSYNSYDSMNWIRGNDLIKLKT